MISYEISNYAKPYVHRIGSTGRTGANGTALFFAMLKKKLT
jgi:superfamily II DNA/RNA helicase